MRRPEHCLRAGQELSLRAARASQALVIAAMDRLAHEPESGEPRPLGRIWALQLDLAGVVLGEPADLVDDGYRYTERLVGLHRAFAQRLMEAIDARGSTWDDRDTATVAPVIPLVAAGVRRS